MKAEQILKVSHIRDQESINMRKHDIKRTKLPTGDYNHDDESVYSFLNKYIKRKTVIYGRVSTAKQKKILRTKLSSLRTGHSMLAIKSRMSTLMLHQGFHLRREKEFFQMLDEILDFKVETVILAYKDRLSRTGFELFSNLFAKFGTKIVVVSK